MRNINFFQAQRKPRSDEMKATKKALGQYVRQRMEARGLSARQVAERSGNRITAAYVTGIMKGSAANPSVEKMKALAEGLGVGRDELFDVACGKPERQAAGNRDDWRLHSLMLLDLMRKVAASSQLMAIVHAAAELSPEGQAEVLKYLQDLNETDCKTESRRN